ncbi:urea ABC transporter, permease protein UrtB [Halohasta litorea]|uniref:Urea ABC transporter, permease protein UrtB n=1 Tax=Halohasta litorea TaxID=869891 RepID=A0ABD6D585_9EURY|nr:urea ABC transporter, permease protein UrtB [Halohasta litorea]MEA1931912.1 urea ABC transporter, permease protein UrtB [Euryarchaeota archaeon]
MIEVAATPLQLSAPSLGALLFQFLNSFGFIILATVGLAIIFGMMGVINLAHGEFILIGVYGTALTYHAGVPLPLAMVAGVVVTTIFGVIVERTVVRHLYDRLLDSMVATWGLALVISQLLLIVFGSSLDSISTPMGSVSYGPFSSSIYRSIFLPIVAVAVLGGLYVLFTRTEFGVKARATIKDPETARAMGVDTDRMYVSTFAIGSALAGLTGALYAPALGSITPNRGSTFLVEAFVAVVVGGPSVIIGTLSASAVLSVFNATGSFFFGTFIGQMLLLLVAIVALRLLPDGITGYVKDWQQRRRAEQ